MQYNLQLREYIVEVYIDALFTSTATASVSPEAVAPSKVRTSRRSLSSYRRAPAVTTFAADVLSLLTATGLTSILVGFEPVQALPGIALLTVLAALIGAGLLLSGLYNIVGLHPAQELKRVVIVTTVVYASCIISVALTDTSPLSLSTLTVAWVLALVFLPVFRVLSRVLFAQATSWWGAPVVVLASGDAGEAVLNTFKRCPELGLRPVALLQHDAPTSSSQEVSVSGDLDLAPMLARAYQIPYAIIAIPGLDHKKLTGLVGRYTKFFKRVFVVPDMPGAQAIWTADRSFEGLLGYSVQHCTWNQSSRLAKRLLDIIGAVIGLILLAPLFLALGLLIKLDSRGPIFFRQERLGQDGRIFRVLKFRSMYANAEERLQEILRVDPERRREYEVFHKLRDDPRVTPIGRLVRRYSLDELPQLWNVLKGEMSLVGPRAYLPRELPKMMGMERTVLQNPPGLTGLWQVSGRNALSFEERVRLDVHYMQNWSFWLDHYILIKTIPVVLTGDGAS